MTWVWRYYKQVEDWLSSPCTLSFHDNTQFEKSSLVTPVSTLKQISSPPQSSTLHLSWTNLKSYSNSISEINCAGKNESPEWLYWIPQECRAGDTDISRLHLSSALHDCHTFLVLCHKLDIFPAWGHEFLHGICFFINCQGPRLQLTIVYCCFKAFISITYKFKMARAVVSCILQLSLDTHMSVVAHFCDMTLDFLKNVLTSSSLRYFDYTDYN